MLSYGLVVPLIHLLVAVPLLYYAGWCLKTGKKCVPGFAETLMGVAVAVFLYHGYKLVLRLGLFGSENIVRQGGYLGRETFVPFSFPYQDESTRYYSFHDTDHTRNCNCAHNDGHTGCHATCMCDKGNCACGKVVSEAFDTASPASESRVGSRMMM